MILHYLDDKNSSKVTDDNGYVSKDDFVKIAMENKLLDFGHVMAGDASRKQKNSSKYTSYTTGQELGAGKVGCF